MYRSVSASAVPRLYYASTAIFLLLDLLVDFNVRLAFLEPWPAWRAAYYLFCFACLGLIVWRPALTVLVSTIESLITLTALILSFGSRVLGMSANVLETGSGIITVEEIINFGIAGGFAWYAWMRGSDALSRQYRG